MCLFRVRYFSANIPWKADKFWSSFRHAVQEEEGLVDIFEHASAQELKDLAERFMQAKMSAPLMPQA